MDQPPPELVDCPTCGAKNPAVDNRCAACGKSLTVVIGPRPKMRHVGLGSVMIVIAVLALCFAAMRATPGLGIPVALFLVPATLRAGVHIESRRAEGRPMTWSEKNDSIATSIMLALILLPAAGIAFAATCVPIGCAAGNGLDAEPGAQPAIDRVMVVAVTAGTLMGIFASFALGRKFWPRKDG